MRQRTFVWSLGTVPGTEPGWLPENAAPGWYPGPGFLTAHDTIEHLSDKSDWAHELRAAGVAAYSGISGRSVQSVAQDIISFGVRDHKFEVPLAPSWASKPLSEGEDRVQALVDAIRKGIAIGTKRAQEIGKAIPSGAASFADKAAPWIRLGYRNALRVYGKGKGRATGKLMDKLAAAINADHNETPPVKGDKLVVSVDPRAKTFTLKRENIELPHAARERRAKAEEISADPLLAALLGALS